METDQLINMIDFIPSKSKIIIMDCCHSGSIDLKKKYATFIPSSIDQFVGHGYAVMASCAADQTSGFRSDRQMSLYTGFVCDALTFRPLIREGKKSLEAINNFVFRLAALSCAKGIYEAQHPIFRTDLGGTIFFEVEGYTPYHISKVHEETDKYIIYSVEPSHTFDAKRLTAKIILRYPMTYEEIAEISKEVKNKVMFSEIHQNRMAEDCHKNSAANIIWCHFGYDEDDVVNNTYYCYTTWVDDTQDKRYWYTLSQDTSFINGVHLRINTNYEFVKELQKSTVTSEKLINMTKKNRKALISAAHQYISYFREYENGVISENKLIQAVRPLNTEIDRLYFERSAFPIAPKELHDWAQANTELACTIHDFTLYYNEKYLYMRLPENRRNLMKMSIRRYETELEKLKRLDQFLEDD